jgi:hypothetical protein
MIINDIMLHMDHISKQQIRKGSHELPYNLLKDSACYSQYSPAS